MSKRKAKESKDKDVKGEPCRNGRGREPSTQETVWLRKEKSLVWGRMQRKPGGHSENSEKGSDGLIGSLGSREYEILQGSKEDFRVSELGLGAIPYDYLLVS